MDGKLEGIVKTIIPSVPPDCRADNELTGKVIVSVHAWQRFCQYWRQINPGNKRVVTAERLAKKLCESFARARADALSESIKVHRLINNGCERADYLIDVSLGLRFVVSDDSQRTIITVERPLRTRKQLARKG